MAKETILQHWIFTEFVLPFLFIFAIVFAILEKTKVLGDNKHQVNAIVAFVMGLIFVSAVYPKEVVGNLILFLIVAIVVVFVGLLLWGFVSGGEAKIENGKVKWVAGGVVAISVIIAVLWATGTQGGIFSFLFTQSWSPTFWTNVLFIIVIGAAIALVINASKSK